MMINSSTKRMNSLSSKILRDPDGLLSDTVSSKKMLLKYKRLDVTRFTHICPA